MMGRTPAPRLEGWEGRNSWGQAERQKEPSPLWEDLLEASSLSLCPNLEGSADSTGF